MIRITAHLVVACAALLIGCEKKPPQAPTSPTSDTSSPVARPGTAKSEGPAAPAGGHHGAVVELGNATIGTFSVRASRDQGEINPGGDAPIDVWLTGSVEKVLAVRFWIGTHDAKGSVKAKADIEDPKEPNHWHTHVEVPNPLPPGSKLWVEIETKGRQKTSGSFYLQN